MLKVALRNAGSICRHHGRYGFTIFALLVIGLLGHTSHWSLGGLFHQEHAESNEHRAFIQRTSHVSDEEGQDAFEGSNFHNSKAAIELAEVKQVRLRNEIIASASVEYDQHRVVEISSRVPGTVYRIERRWGQDVEARDVLAYVEAGEVGKAKSEFAKALFEKRTRDQILSRFHQSRDALPVRQITEAEAASQSARIALLSAEQALVNLGFPMRGVEFAELPEEQVLYELRWLGIPAEARKELENQTSSSNLLPIRAPMNGVVIGRDASIGEVVSFDRPFIRIADVSKMWIVLDIRKEDAGNVRIGQNITFDPDGNGNDVIGTVSWISTEVDPKTRTLQVRAEVENARTLGADGNFLQQYVLRANMFGAGRVITREPYDGLAVGKESLHHINGDTVLFVHKGEDQFVPVTVQTGATVDGLVEIIGDVEPGAEVAGKGGQLLKSDLLLNRQLGLNR